MPHPRHGPPTGRTPSVRSLENVAAGTVDAFLDEDGLLRRGDRWVAVPLSQIPVVRLLLERVEHPVTVEEISAVYEACGHSSKRASVRAALHRLRVRMAPLDLSLESVGQSLVVLHELGLGGP